MMDCMQGQATIVLSAAELAGSAVKG